MFTLISQFLLNHTPLLYLTQSLWRDEAFSVYLSEPGIPEIIQRTSGDFNPPLYYILLHFWMTLFGRDVIALRLFSTVAFMLFVLVVHIFAEKLFKSKKVVWFVTLLALLNPMLLYFAFELRMYALLTLFATLSMYFLYLKNWKFYVVTTALGLYTQPFMAFVVLSQGVYVFFQERKSISTLIKSWIVIGILYLPWIPTLLTQFKASGPMWMWPIDTNLIFSVIGNVFFGYEGTPGDLWNIMKVFSLLFILATVFLVKKDTKNHKRNWLFIIWTFVPLILVLGISLIKPIYVHRYVIFVTVGQIFVLGSLFNYYAKNKLAQGIACSFIFFLFCAQYFIAPFHHKVPLRETFLEIEQLVRDDDSIFAENPLVFYESLYYAKDPKQVFLYNPQFITPPRFTGNVGMPSERWRPMFPRYPNRAFLIKNDGSFETVSSF